MEFILIGIVSAFNLIIIKVKLEKKRYEDAVFDLSLMGLLAFLFAGSYGGMVVAMVASLAISIYLLISPPKFTSTLREKAAEELEEIKRMNRCEKTEKKKTQETFDL